MVNLKSKKIYINLLYAFGAQGISLMLSIIMSLIVPKFLGVKDFSYWQLFIFYSGYVGFCQFGLQDGMYLRMGGSRYDEINISLIGTQLKLSMLIQTIVGIIGISVCNLLIVDNSRIFIIVSTVIYMIISSFSAYIGYIFQAVNEIKKYSISVMIDRITFIMFILILSIASIRNFKVFVILYLVSKFISLLYCIYIGKQIVFSNIYNVSYTLKEMWTNVTVGINLMIANIASLLVLGIGRFIIDKTWGIEVFGKISFSISLMNFFLMFISQASMVLFPALRQLNEEQLKKVYINMRNNLGLFFPSVFLMYIPIKVILSIWIPKYEISLIYLALLLPITVFDGNMNLLCNTYFKVLRKEKILLKINLVTMILSFILNFIGAFLLENVVSIIIFMVLSIAFRNIVSEIYLSKLLNTKIHNMLFQKIVLTVIFMGSSYNLSSIKSFCIISIFYSFYLLLNVRQLMTIIEYLKGKVRNKKILNLRS